MKLTWPWAPVTELHPQAHSLFFFYNRFAIVLRISQPTNSIIMAWRFGWFSFRFGWTWPIALCLIGEHKRHLPSGIMGPVITPGNSQLMGSAVQHKELRIWWFLGPIVLGVSWVTPGSSGTAPVMVRAPCGTEEPAGGDYKQSIYLNFCTVSPTPAVHLNTELDERSPKRCEFTSKSH